MKQAITMTQMMAATHRLHESGKKFTHLGIGPMSENLLRAVFKLANERRFPLILIASRNQIDSQKFGGGYVCGFDQARFVAKSEQIAQEIGFDGLCYFCRDHGGPWQRDQERADKLPVERAMQIALESYADDIRAGFDLLHIDPTKDPHCTGVVPLRTVLERTVFLIEKIEQMRRENHWKEVAYEVGTEETMGGLIEPEVFEDFIRALRDDLQDKGLPMPLFVVGQTGTLTRLTSNVGQYDTLTAKRLSDITHKYGTGLKEHNGDYLQNAILLEHPILGLDAMNVAPEFGMAETQAILDLAQIEDKFVQERKRSGIRAILSAHAVKGERWRKWMVGEKRTYSVDRILQEQEDVRLICVMCGHYTLDEDEVKESLCRLRANLMRIGTDADGYIQKQIQNAILRYIDCFHLNGTTDQIISGAQ